MILSNQSIRKAVFSCAAGLLVGIAGPVSLFGQGAAPVGPTAGSFQGSVARGQVSPQPVDLSLDDAIHRGLQANLGTILSGTQTASVRGQMLNQLQELLPAIQLNAREAVSQVDLPAQGFRLPGIPTVIGPFGYVDIRAALNWSVLDLDSLRNYMAAKHNFSGAQLSAQDARDMVVLTVGNAYCWCWPMQVSC